MDNVEIEVRARTVELAVEAAMQELGIDDADRLEVKVITEPSKGFLGMGGQDAVVLIKPRPAREGRKRRGRKGGTGSQPQNRTQGRHESGKNGGRGQRQPRPESRQQRPVEKREKSVPDDRPVLPVEEQARIARDFLEGLVDAYGLEGTVTTRVEDDDVIVADVSGEQTEALVGVRGTVRAAIHEITRTVLQRHGQDSARLRLDIAGYAERRRQALTIYAEQLIEQLMSEGGEIMLEPMSPADRKVIHDVAGAHERVTSYSEGEPPRRYVVLSRVESSEEE